jgi:hypothetical protein
MAARKGFHASSAYPWLGHDGEKSVHDRHSGRRGAAIRNLEIPGSMLRIAPGMTVRKKGPREAGLEKIDLRKTDQAVLV